MPAWRNLRTATAAGRRFQMAINREEFCIESIRKKTKKFREKLCLVHSTAHSPSHFLLLPSSAEALHRIIPSPFSTSHLFFHPKPSPRTQVPILCKSLLQSIPLLDSITNSPPLIHSFLEILPLHQSSASALLHGSSCAEFHRHPVEESLPRKLPRISHCS